MKIVSWNCAGKFREDYNEILKQNADIYVIQECEDPDAKYDKYKKYKEAVYKFAGGNVFWTGNLHYKGLGVFVNKDLNVEEITTKGPYKHFMAFKIGNSFYLLAVWAMNKDKELGLPPYVEMIHDFLDENKDEELFDGTPIIMCGDFNSSAVFNPKHTYKRSHRDIHGNPKNHTCLDCKLNKKGLVSVYHELTKEKSGEEKYATFFQARHFDEPFHLDYVYASKELIKGKTTFKNEEKGNNLPNEFEILDKDEWISLSDHLPIIFTFDEENLENLKKEKVDDEYSNIEKECKKSDFNI